MKIRNKIIAFTIMHFPDKESVLHVLLSKQGGNTDRFSIPCYPSTDNSSEDNLLTEVANLNDKFEYLGNRINAQGEYLDLIFFSPIHENQFDTLSTPKNMEWIEYNELKNINLDKNSIEQIMENYDRICSTKGVKFIETILLMLPNEFTIKDAESAAFLFGYDRKKTHIFFRYFREQTRPPEKTFLNPTLKINEVGKEDKPKSKKGKPAVIYKIIK